MKIAIIGAGNVGGALAKLMPAPTLERTSALASWSNTTTASATRPALTQASVAGRMAG